MKATTFVPLDAILATNAAEAVLLNTNRRALATAVFDRGLLPPVSVSNDRARRTGVFLALFSGMPGAGDVRREYRDAGWRLVVDSSYVDGVMLRAYPPAATH